MLEVKRLVFSLDLNKNDKIWDNESPIINNYKLSLQLAKKLGYIIVFYGDITSLKLLEDYYDEGIKLNSVGGNNVWSEAKFEALGRETEFPVIHVDGDLFMTGKLVFDKEADIFIDQFEKSTWTKYYSKVVKEFDSHNIKSIFPEWYNFNIKPSNIGIVGFKDKEIRDLYLDRYWKINSFYKDEFGSDGGKLKGIPSMTIGQHSLSCIAKYHNLIIQEVTIKSEFLHMWGIRKYEPTFQKFIKHFLKNIDEGNNI